MNLQNVANRIAAVVLFSCVAATFPPENAFAQLTATPNDSGFLITENGQPVLQYQLTTTSKAGKWPRSNYVHPLYNLDGDAITEDFPDDHGHHRGVFWAWHQVSAGDVKLGDAWICEDFQWDTQAKKATSPTADSISIQAHVHWKSPQLQSANGQLTPVVSEHTSITVHAQQPTHRAIDFDIRLKALVPDVRIGGSDDEKGYGGFSPRLKLTKQQTFSSAMGEIEPEKKAIAAGPWIDLSDSKWGLAILTHPQNPGSPQPWILRRQRSMQNAVYPGRQPVSISTELETRLRYRLVIHRGSPSGLDFSKLQAEYAATDRTE